MDGYIKNKTEAIKAVRKSIFYKYAVTFLIVIFIPVWLFALAVNQPPENWTHTEIVFSHVSQERIGLRRGRSHVMNTQEGRQFVINSKFVDVDELSNYLVPGNTYRIVFSNTIAGGDHMKALSDDNVVFQSLDDSVAQWEQEQRKSVIAIIITLVIEVVVLILIDRLWCKDEYAQIQKLRADIKHREDSLKDR